MVPDGSSIIVVTTSKKAKKAVPRREAVLLECARKVAIAAVPKSEAMARALVYAQKHYPETTASQISALVDLNNIRAFLTVDPTNDICQQAVKAVQLASARFFDRDLPARKISPRLVHHVIFQLDLYRQRILSMPSHNWVEALKAQEDSFVSAKRATGFSAPLEAWRAALDSWTVGAWKIKRPAGRRGSKKKPEWEDVLGVLLDTDPLDLKRTFTAWLDKRDAPRS